MGTKGISMHAQVLPLIQVLSCRPEAHATVGAMGRDEMPPHAGMGPRGPGEPAAVVGDVLPAHRLHHYGALFHVAWHLVAMYIRQPYIALHRPDASSMHRP